MAGDHLDVDPGSVDGPGPAKGADRAAGARPKAGEPEPAGPSQPEDAGTTEEEALRALSGAAAIRDERVRAASIVDELFRRLGDDPAPRIGSINVLDKVEIAEGGLTIGAGRTTRSAEPRTGEAVALLDSAFIEHRARTYVRPSGFGRALDILTKRHLLVLCGSQGSGREAAALALLMETAERSRLHLVSGTALLAEHGWSCGEPGTGFAVAPLDSAAAGQLDDVWLEQAAKRLSNAGNFMVVVTGAPSGAFAAADRRADFAFEDLGFPDPVAILTKRAKNEVDPACMPALTSLLSRSDVKEIVTADNSPAFAARVARAIAEALNERKDVEETIRTLRNPAAQVLAWFDRYDGDAGTDYRQIVLPIAVSVLEDSSYLTVTDAAVALYRRLLPEEDGPPPLRFRRSLREQQQWIQLASSGSTSSAQRELLRFRSPMLRAAVLQHTWTWLDGIRPALSGWLDDLAAHPAVDVRARAAASAGLLATLDFPYALHHFLYPWAGSRSAAARDCAALALTIPGRSPQYETQVWALLRDWAANAPERSGSELAGTAAEAAGSVLGQHRPGDALNVLHEVLKRNEWDSLTALVLAVLNLAENGCTAEVLAALVEWSEPNDGSAPVIKALAAFALIARTPATAEAASPPRVPGPKHAPPKSASRGPSRLTGTAVQTMYRSAAGRAGGPDGRPDGALDGRGTSRAAHSGHDAPADRLWPVFFKEAGNNPQAIRDLWGRALAAKPVRSLALDALHFWLELADTDANALARVSRVIRDIAGLGGKHPARMEYYLDLWAHDPKQPLRAARHILS